MTPVGFSVFGPRSLVPAVGPMSPGNADGAAHSDAVSVYAALRAGRFALSQRLLASYFASPLNFDVDQK